MFNFDSSWIFLSIFLLAILILVLIFLWPKVNYSWLDKICTFLVISFPFQGIPSLLGEVANLRLSQVIVMAGLSTLAILIWKKDPQTLRTPIQPIFGWMLIFILVSLPSWFLVQNVFRFGQYLLGVLLVFGATLLLAHFGQDLWRKSKYLVGSMFLACMFAAYQFAADMLGFTKYSFLSDIYTKEIFGIPRVHSFFLEPLLFAGALFFPIIITLLALVSRQPILTIPKRLGEIFKKMHLGLMYKPYFLHLAGTVIFSFFFLLTYSKSAFLALSVAVLPIVFLAVWKYRDWLTIKLLGLISLVGVAMLITLSLVSATFGAAIEEIGENFYTSLFGNSSTSAERNAFLDIATEFLPDFALTGAGAGQYGSVAGFALRYLGGESGELIINNIYLEIWFEYGFLALVAFLGLWLAVFNQSIKLLKKSPDWRTRDTVLRLGLTLALGAYLIQWWFFSPIYIMPIFILLGLLLGLNAETEK